MPDSPPSVIHWYRRDLRIADNTALLHAASFGLAVAPVYFLSSWKKHHGWTGPNRQQFLCGCLESLSKNLETLDGRLLIRSGDPVEGLKKLIRETRAVAVCFNEDPDPFGKEIEKKVRAMCASLGVECHSHADAAMHGPEEVLTQGGQPYRVYTPYSRNWLSLDKALPAGKPAKLRTPSSLRPCPCPPSPIGDSRRRTRGCPKPANVPRDNA